MKEVIKKIKDNPLFNNMKVLEIEHTLKSCQAEVKSYYKNNKIFSQEDPPEALYILISGTVVVCRDFLNGRRYIVTSIVENEMFGEVYLFLENEGYPYYALATSDCKVLEIPKAFFFHYCKKTCDSNYKNECNNNCENNNIMIRNMLIILAKKAFFLNNKVQLLSHGTLRQKIGKYIHEQLDESMYIKLSMNREELADYLSVTRPSLSRELKNMEKDGLIEVDRDIVKVLHYGKLLDCIEGIEE